MHDEQVCMYTYINITVEQAREQLIHKPLPPISHRQPRTWKHRGNHRHYAGSAKIETGDIHTPHITHQPLVTSWHLGTHPFAADPFSEIVVGTGPSASS